MTYATPPWLVAALAAAAAALAVFAAHAPAAPERLLFTVPAVACAMEALRSALLRPTLATNEQGIEVVTGWRRERHPWSSVVAVQVMGPPSSGRQLRRRGNALEIDLGERLLVIPGYRLGVPVAQVAAGMTISGAHSGTTGGF